MPSKFYSRLQSSLLISAGLSLGLATVIPVAEARIASNGISLQGTSFGNGLILNAGWPKNGTSFNGVVLNNWYPNGIALNGTNLKIDSGSTAQLQLEGSQLVLYVD